MKLKKLNFYLNALKLIFDEKCINKKERVRHLPGYCRRRIKMQKRDELRSFQPALRPSSAVEEDSFSTYQRMWSQAQERKYICVSTCAYDDKG